MKNNLKSRCGKIGKRFVVKWHLQQIIIGKMWNKWILIFLVFKKWVIKNSRFWIRCNSLSNATDNKSLLERWAKSNIRVIRCRKTPTTNRAIRCCVVTLYIRYRVQQQQIDPLSKIINYLFKKI